jgi:hypothetical protein
MTPLIMRWGGSRRYGTLTEEDWRAGPNLEELGGGFVMTRVSEVVAVLTRDLLEQTLVPGPGWSRSGTD